MTLTAGLIASRIVHYFALSALFGGALFPFYGFAPPHVDAYARLPWLRPVLFVAALFTLASGIAWFAFAAAGMNGRPIWNTDFGRAWLFRLLLSTGLVLALLGRHASDWRCRSVLFGSLVLLAGIAFTGHAGNDQGAAAVPQRIADVFHLIAAGAWVGALVVFTGMAISTIREHNADDIQTFHDVLSRFSGIGSLLVATLVLSGLINPGFLAGFQTAYGRLLLIKYALFGTMLLLAAANRFWLTPRLVRALHSTAGPERALHALRASLAAEAGLGVCVMAIVGWLGTLPPG